MNAPSLSLAIERVLDAPVASLWRCWTEPDLLKQWFCPRPWRVTEALIELRPSGRFAVVMNGPDGEEARMTGVYLQIEWEKQIVFTNAFREAWIPSEKAFMVGDVRFDPMADGRTLYRASAHHWTEEDMKTHEAMGFHAGWNKAADQLEELARTLHTPQ